MAQGLKMLWKITEIIFNNESLFLPTKRPTKRASDAGDLRQSQAASHALAFFWLDGFAVPPYQMLVMNLSLSWQ